MKKKYLMLFIFSIICASFSYIYITSKASKSSYLSSFFSKPNFLFTQAATIKKQNTPNATKVTPLSFKERLYKYLPFFAQAKLRPSVNTIKFELMEEKEQDKLQSKSLNQSKQIISYTQDKKLSQVSKKPVSKEAFEKFKKEVQENLNVDLVSYKETARMMRGFKYINNAGTLEQKKWALNIITIQKPKIIQHLNNGFTAILHNQDFITGVKAVGVSVVSAGTGTAIFNVLQLTGGRAFEPHVLQDMGFAISSTQLFQKIGPLAAEAGIAQLITLVRGGGSQVRLLDHFMAKAVMTSMGVVQATPLTYAIATLANEASGIFTEAIEARGGMSELVNKIDWRDVAIGAKAQSKAIQPFAKQHQSIIAYGKSVVTNINVKQVIGTIAKEAMFSAVLAGGMYLLGLGFSDEVDMASTFDEALIGVGTSMAYGAIRGGVQGLVEYALVGAGRAGAITKIATATTIRAVQRLLSGEAAWVAAEGVVATVAEVTPTIIKQFVKSATETVINQMGGAEQAVKEVLSATSEGASIHFKNRKKEFVKVTQPTTKKVSGWFSNLTNRISDIFVLDIDMSDMDMTGTVG